MRSAQESGLPSPLLWSIVQISFTFIFGFVSFALRFVISLQVEPRRSPFSLRFDNAKLIKMLRLENIWKSFGNLEVLRDVSLEIGAGELLAIVGPSGAGKTTLLQIAGTLDRPDRGKVMFGDMQLDTLSDRRLSEFRNRSLGFVFQFHQLLPEFSARENIALPALIAGSSRKEAFRRADELMEMLGIASRAGHKPPELSGGEKQRVAIARALVNRPPIIFADEPTGSLDTANRDQILNLIASLREETGTTFVIVTHDPTIARSADRRIEMQDGRIIDTDL